MRKVAIFFPGIGYTIDRPLLYFCRKLVEELGYTLKPLSYSGFPSSVRGDREKQILCYEIAQRQTEELLAGTELTDYDEILLVGKSIGTVVAAEIANRSSVKHRIRHVLYTPLEDTFSVPIHDAIVFTGSSDPWVEDGKIQALCAEREIPCHLFPGANHSLETGDTQRDLDILRRVLQTTERFLNRMTLREAQESDLTEIAVLHIANQRAAYRGLLSDSYLDGLDPARQQEKWESFFRQEGQKIFVVRNHASLLGFAAWKKDEEIPECLYLDSLHVAPGAQGQGVGTALILQAAQCARENGYQTMSVCIVKGNEGARRLYTRMGAVHRKDFTDHFEGTSSHSEKLWWPKLPSQGTNPPGCPHW